MLGDVNKLFVFKVCWQRPVMFCLYTSTFLPIIWIFTEGEGALLHTYIHWRWRWWEWIQDTLWNLFYFKSIRPNFCQLDIRSITYALEKIQFQFIAPFKFFMQMKVPHYYYFSYLSLALSFENPSITAPESAIRTKIKRMKK